MPRLYEKTEAPVLVYMPRNHQTATKNLTTVPGAVSAASRVSSSPGEGAAMKDDGLQLRFVSSLGPELSLIISTASVGNSSGTKKSSFPTYRQLAPLRRQRNASDDGHLDHEAGSSKVSRSPQTRLRCWPAHGEKSPPPLNKTCFTRSRDGCSHAPGQASMPAN